jgi:hypothetical protein
MYDGVDLDIVDRCTYLGIVLNYNNTVSVAELFTLNRRLLDWSILIITDDQFGFKPGFSTKYCIFLSNMYKHVFSVPSLISRKLSTL